MMQQKLPVDHHNHHNIAQESQQTNKALGKRTHPSEFCGPSFQYRKGFYKPKHTFWFMDITDIYILWFMDISIWKYMCVYIYLNIIIYIYIWYIYIYDIYIYIWYMIYIYIYISYTNIYIYICIYLFIHNQNCSCYVNTLTFTKIILARSWGQWSKSSIACHRWDIWKRWDSSGNLGRKP